LSPDLDDLVGRQRLSYGSDPRQYVDLTGDPALPGCVLLVHGGFWRAEKDSESLWPAVTALAKMAGCVGSVEYRTADAGGRWPACRDDVVAAVRAVWAAGADPRSTVLVGHSAGGHLALAAAGQLAEPVAVVALAAVSDLVAASRDQLGDDAVEVLLGPAPDEDALLAASPWHQPPPAGRIELVHGDADQAVPVAYSRRLAEHWAATADVRLTEVPDARHMHLVNPDRPAWPVVAARIAAAVAPAEPAR